MGEIPLGVDAGAWSAGRETCTSQVLCQLQEAPGVALPRIGPLIRLSVQHLALCAPFWDKGTAAAGFRLCSPTPQRLLALPGWRGLALSRQTTFLQNTRNSLPHLLFSPCRAAPISHLTSPWAEAVSMAPVLCNPTSALCPQGPWWQCPSLSKYNLAFQAWPRLPAAWPSSLSATESLRPEPQKTLTNPSTGAQSELGGG